MFRSERVRLGVLTPAQDFFGMCGFSLSEITLRQTLFEFLIGLYVEGLSHLLHNESRLPPRPSPPFKPAPTVLSAKALYSSAALARTNRANS
jgi:hypothetical protein